MSKLDELIKEFCRGGVEYKPLKDVCDFNRGKSLTSKDAQKGDIPVVSGGQKPAFFHNVANRWGQTIIVAGSGAYAGYVSYWETPIFCADSFSVDVKNLEELNIKYLYYFLLNNQDNIYNKKTGAGIPHVHGRDIANFKIPLPPIPVQEEIVRILDLYNTKQEELISNLTKEKDFRNKQYISYRDKLLAFDASVPVVSIGDVCEVFIGGEAPTDCIKGDVCDEQHQFAVWGNGKDIYGYSGNYKIDKDSVVISSIGANTGTVYFRKAFFTPIIRLKVVIPIDDNLDVRYLFHALSSSEIKSKSSSVPNMNANDIKKIKIPLPSLDIQKRIVDTLDNFDKICTDLNIGLPAEIEARQKEYEFYRNELLSFDYLNAERRTQNAERA